ncbi:hypothetical protein [Paenibacillus silviterrae]|nr:hypothetical protein [Paenibacillus chinjuensis]
MNSEAVAGSILPDRGNGNVPESDYTPLEYALWLLKQKKPAEEKKE